MEWHPLGGCNQEGEIPYLPRYLPIILICPHAVQSMIILQLNIDVSTSIEITLKENK